ncbi:2-hydroxyacyl-CoA dehydratase family protein [Devosia sp. CAU 1758]
MDIAPGLDAEQAREALDAAFAAEDRSARDMAGPCIGIFGNGVPETLIAAAGATPIHVNFCRMASAGPMDAVIEPFVDAEVRIFLNRFATGHFDALAGIVFARDDAAALTAYQYATEWVRQGRAAKTVPALFLFNLVHKSGTAAARFNQIQCDKLQDFLVRVGLSVPGAEALAAKAEHAARRQSALVALDAVAPGALASRWRNAGRFLPVARHADLLETALQSSTPKPTGHPRLGLVGSPIVAPGFFDMLDTMGDLACNAQALGQVWPGPWEIEHQRNAMLAALADDPFCLRISPPGRHRQALLDAITAANCSLVICQLAQTDDTFGWEIPGLMAALAERGIGFVNLGFRDPEPDAGWLSHAAGRIAAALEPTS